jgi:tetratricopeptide (TPR) repeat protein
VKSRVIYQILGLAIAFMLLFSADAVQAQAWTLDILGSVKKEETKKRFEGVTITVKRNGSVWKTITSPSNGKFDLGLPPDAIYVIEFSKFGHVTKKIELSTKNVPPEDAKYGFEFPMEMNLFEKMEGLDVSILNQPIAKIGFDPSTGYFDYDPAYTKSIQKELDRLKKELAARLKEEEANRKQKQKDYDAAIMAADKAFNSERWKEAKTFYEKAESIFPDESYPGFQLAEISDKLAAFEEAEKRYKSAIEKADAAFQAREWNKAINSYEYASELKESEEYPKNKVKEIEEILKNEKKVAEEYAEAIADADAALAEKNYDKAKENYQKATGLKSYEEYPKEKLKEIETILAELAKKEEEYKAAVAEADKLFAEKAYEKSIEGYNKALGMKPDESYPKEKIAEANNLIAEQKQLEEQYKGLIASADASFDSKDYETAKSTYEEALELKSAEEYPQKRIAEIAELLGAAAKLEEDYNNAIKAGDAAFDTEKYDEAKTSYEQALALKSEEQYPKDKLEEIKLKLEELAKKKAEEEAAALAQKKLDEEYNALIASADAAMGNEDYDKAKADYTAALGVKSQESYPQEKLDEIANILAELARKKAEEEAAQMAQKEIDEKYKTFIADADAAFSSKSYDEATQNYSSALGLKSEEQYPKDKIKEIEDILAAIAKAKEEDELAAEADRKKREYYDAVVAQADAELTAENYEEAKSKYNQALAIIPDEEYPKGKLKEIEDILAKLNAEKENALLAQKQIDEKYNKLIADADKAFNAENYSSAQNNYKAALNVKSQEQYPQDQLDKILDILEEIKRKEEEIKVTNNALQQKQEDYDNYIKLADEGFASKQYETAKSNYERALGIMPTKTYPKEKIKEIEAILADLAAKQNEANAAELAEKEKRAAYNRLVADGDKAIRGENYQIAQSKFNAALNLYPDEKYPSDKLAEILELLKKKNEVKKEEVVAVTNTNGSRAKITDAKEREIERKMAALKNKANLEKDKQLEKEREIYATQEEIRITGGVKRTNNANEELDKYEDDIIAMIEKGNKHHIQNSKDLDATTKQLNKAELNRIKKADKRRNKSDKELGEYQKEFIKFAEEQERLSRNKANAHNKYVDNVKDIEKTMVSKGDNVRANNRKDLEKQNSDNIKQEAKAKKRAEDLQIDVKKYKAAVAQEEKIYINSSVNRTAQNKKDIDKLHENMNKEFAKKDNYYKLNVAALNQFRAKVEKVEQKRIADAEKARNANEKIKVKMQKQAKKQAERQSKRYYKDAQNVDKFRAQVQKDHNSRVSDADKRRVEANKKVLEQIKNQGSLHKSQAGKYKEFDRKLAEVKKQNDEFNSDLRSKEAEKLLLASSKLTDVYSGEKLPKQNAELKAKYPAGITEEIEETGNAITIKRVKVTGDQVDVYERVFYNWGGTYYYKNGVNIVQALWDKESIE